MATIGSTNATTNSGMGGADSRDRAMSVKLLVRCLTDLDANGHLAAAAYVNTALCLVNPAYAKVGRKADAATSGLSPTFGGCQTTEQDDLEFYRRREADERADAAACEDPAIAKQHLQLADQLASLIRRYARMAQAMRAPLPAAGDESAEPRSA